MAAGLTRVQALRRLTAVSGGDGARGGAIDDFTISPDGTQVAFSSARTVFDLGTLSLVSPPETEALAQQLYEGDLSNGTLTHVTIGYEGQRTESLGSNNKPTGSPDFSGDDSLLAFSSPLYNLVYGDGNSANDVVRGRKSELPRRTGRPGGVAAAAQPDRRTGLAAERDGDPRPHRRRNRVRRRPGSGLAADHGSRHDQDRLEGRTRKARGPLPSCRAGSSRARRAAPPGAGLVQLALKPSKSYWKNLEAPHGVLAQLKVSFAAAGHRTLSQTVSLTLHRAKPRPASTRRARRRRA